MNRAKNAVLHVELHAPSKAAGLLPSFLGPGARAKSSRLERLSFKGGGGCTQCELQVVRSQLGEYFHMRINMSRYTLKITRVLEYNKDSHLRPHGGAHSGEAGRFGRQVLKLRGVVGDIKEARDQIGAILKGAPALALGGRRVVVPEIMRLQEVQCELRCHVSGFRCQRER